jgi:hypothetical protein
VSGFGEDAFGSVVSLPVDGSQGVAMALIDIDLSGGRTLEISGIGNGGTFEIGRIRISNADASSRIVISGGVQIDILRIDMDDAAAAMLEIINDTAGGDIVAIDVAGLTRLDIAGNLGTTDVPAWGPKLIGPELGLSADLVEAVGGALGFDAPAGGGFIDQDFGGEIYRPIGLDTAAVGEAFLDDVGGPMDSRLNGLVVRDGDVQEVNVRGSIRDVILQGAGATLVNAPRELRRIHGVRQVRRDRGQYLRREHDVDRRGRWLGGEHGPAARGEHRRGRRHQRDLLVQGVRRHDQGRRSSPSTTTTR